MVVSGCPKELADYESRWLVTLGDFQEVSPRSGRSLYSGSSKAEPKVKMWVQLVH